MKGIDSGLEWDASIPVHGALEAWMNGPGLCVGSSGKISAREGD